MKIVTMAARKALTWGFCWRPEKDSNLRPTANPKIGALPGRRQHPAEGGL
jgi:hypothetical protein